MKRATRDRDVEKRLVICNIYLEWHDKPITQTQLQLFDKRFLFEVALRQAYHNTKHK